MSQRMIEVDFNVVKTLLLGTRGAMRRRHWEEVRLWIDKIERIVENANDLSSAESVA